MGFFRRFNDYHLRRKMFNKILLLYSLVMILLFAAAAVMVHQYNKQRFIREAMDADMRSLYVTSAYLSGQYNSIQNTIQQLYADATIIEDLNHFLGSKYEDYLKYKLDRFSESRQTLLKTFDVQLKTYMEQESGVENVIVYSYSGHFYYLMSAKRQQIEYIKPQEAWEQWFADRRKQPWTVEVPKELLPQAREDNLGLYTYVREVNDPFTLKRTGAILVDFNTAQLGTWLASRTPNLYGSMMVLTPDGSVLYSDSQWQPEGGKLPLAALQSYSGEWVQLQELSKVNIVNIGNTGLTAVSILPKSVIDRNTSSLRNNLIGIFLLFIALSVTVTATIMRGYSRKIKRIASAMSRIEEGDLSVRIKIAGEDELQQIARRFNDMCERLQNYIQKVYLSEIKQKNAELVALQTQINPHFLYNTLEAIRMKAYSEGARDVGQMIYILSSIFRSMVKKSTMVSIAEELELCRMYLELFRFRYEGQLTFTTELDPQLQHCMTMKLLVQPIIENYMIHGFRADAQTNRIAVRAFRDGEEVRIVVQDNGAGIEAGRLTQLRDLLEASSGIQQGEERSIGLVNVQERLQTSYGEQYGLEIDSQAGEGTTVTLRLPAITRGLEG
ncbi:sensor histidine kinase [Paenibacillus sp. SYP-B4298]|uniref:sensor histidine kinase n=1 Tax=Paenibacillus sp. SYP-B4298 TaxID=2996034 RepID=UPI0022DE72E6|nr:sensor histidine kinase [Paenibacillus sp. SYP-B4298]